MQMQNANYYPRLHRHQHWRLHFGSRPPDRHCSLVVLGDVEAGLRTKELGQGVNGLARLPRKHPVRVFFAKIILRPYQLHRECLDVPFPFSGRLAPGKHLEVQTRLADLVSQIKKCLVQVIQGLHLPERKMFNRMQLVQLLITIQNLLSKETGLKMSSLLLSPQAAPSVAMRKIVSMIPEMLSI